MQHLFWWRKTSRTLSLLSSVLFSNSPPAGLLRPLPIPTRPWSHIALDFITGLPPSSDNTAILTVVDWFSIVVHFITLPKLPKALEMAKVLTDHVFHLHGIPPGHSVRSGSQVYFSGLEGVLFCAGSPSESFLRVSSPNLRPKKGPTRSWRLLSTVWLRQTSLTGVHSLNG